MSRCILYILLFCTVVSWGTSFAVIKLTIGNLSTLQYLFFRVLFADLIFLLILSKMPREKRKIDKKDIPYMCYLGFIGVVGYFAVQYSALKYTTTVNVSLLVSLAPVLVAIYSAIFYKERFGKENIFGIMLCLIGITFIITKGQLANFSIGENLLGDMLSLLNAVMLMLFCLGAKKALEKYEPFIAVAYMNIFALLMLIPLVLIPNFLSPVSLIYTFKEINIKVLGGTFYLGATCTVLGYYSWYTAIKEFGPTKTSLFNYFTPFIASIVSFILFDEGLNIYTISGGVSIIIGVILNNVHNLITEKNKDKLSA